MKSRTFITAFGVCVISLLASHGLSAPFEPLFQVSEFEVKCQIRIPDADDFTVPEKGKAYPYGSAIKTAKRGSVTVLFSEGNHCKLAPMSACMVNESAGDVSHKSVDLEYGTLAVELEEGFHEANAFEVVTKVASCEAIGCSFEVDAESDTEMDTANFKLRKGKLKITGPNFGVPSMDDGDVLGIQISAERDFTRVETVDGKFGVEVKGSDGSARIIETEEGYVIKIWRRVSESGKTLIITILITTPDGELQEAITYTEPIEVTGEETAPPMDDEDDKKVPGEDENEDEGKKDEDYGDLPPPQWDDDELTMTTTTSTTFPSPTPVGKR